MWCMSGVTGPSPRARGAGSGDRFDVRPHGTIPAGAGSSGSRATRTSRTRDHPRGRGEQDLFADGGDPVGGPSPRARGAALASALSRALNGTIPAGAGSSLAGEQRRLRWRDHPRGRGEQAAALPGDVYAEGGKYAEAVKHYEQAIKATTIKGYRDACKLKLEDAKKKLAEKP